MEVTLTNGKTVIVEPEPIGSVRNLWRKRFIYIHSIVNDMDNVCTMGIGFDGGSNCNAVEPWQLWVQYIGKFNSVIE